jgi:hypothetical protein
VKLAREVYFGEEMMKASTVYGSTGKLALPKNKVDELKKYLISLFPEFRHNGLAFEDKWKKCTDAINHACVALRKN